MYATPSQFQLLEATEPSQIRLTCWQDPTPPILASSKGARSQGSIVFGHVTSSSAMIVIGVLTSGIATQTWRRLFAIGDSKTRMLVDSKVFLNDFSFEYLSEVVTSRISRGLQARMLKSESLSSSKSVDIVGMMTVTSRDVKDGFAGMGIDLYVQ